jgi:hypothetical protein
MYYLFSTCLNWTFERLLNTPEGSEPPPATDMEMGIRLDRTDHSCVSSPTLFRCVTKWPVAHILDIDSKYHERTSRRADV